MINSGSR